MFAKSARPLLRIVLCVREVYMGVIDKVFGSVGLIIFILVILMFIVVTPSCSWMQNEVKVEVIGHAYSPNKTFKAVEYLSMGGGALGFCNRKISILKSDSVMPSEDYRPKSIFAARCGVDVSITWLDDYEIKINYTTKDFKQPNVVLAPTETDKNISVEYHRDT